MAPRLIQSCSAAGICCLVEGVSENAVLQDKVRFLPLVVPSDPLAAAKGPLATSAHIESRDAAPAAASVQHDKAASSADGGASSSKAEDTAADSLPSTAGHADGMKTGGDSSALRERQHRAAALLDSAGSGLSAFWDKHWSHTDITRPPDRTSQEQARKLSDSDARVLASSSDAGHLSTNFQAQSAAVSDPHLRVHLSQADQPPEDCESLHGKQPAGSHIRVTLEIVPPAFKASSDIIAAQKAEHAASKAAGFAPVARLASLGGIIRSQPWRGAAPSALSMSQATVPTSGPERKRTPAAAWDKQEPSSAPACSDGSAKSQTDSNRVRVEIRLQDQDSSIAEDTAEPCTLILSVQDAEGGPPTAASDPAGHSSSRLHSLSGLFRASKPSHAAPATLLIKREENPEAGAGASSSSERPVQAAEQPQAVSSSSAASGQQRARWAISGTAAVASLYNLVHHAAEVPLAQAGRAVGSLPGIRAQAPPQSDSSSSQADADVAADIVMRVKTAASAVLEVSTARSDCPAGFPPIYMGRPSCHVACLLRDLSLQHINDKNSCCNAS